jgi:thioredoxin 1
MKIENKSLLNKGRVIIDFWAPWCGPCKTYKPIVEQFANEQPNVNVYFCNVDEDHELASQYGIRNIPTTIMLENGEIKNRKVGAISYNALLEMSM